jgi:hypothetical protein
MNKADRKAYEALLDATVSKLAWHQQQIAESAEWLDAKPGRREEAEDIAADMEKLIAGLRRDLGNDR